MKARHWIFITGGMWFLIGSMLMVKGLKYMNLAKDQIQDTEFLSVLMFLSLMLGFLKGRFIFAKTVKRIIANICSHSDKITILNVYPLSYWLVLAVMSCMGMLVKKLSLDIHYLGAIDLVIGSALINGAMQYFRAKEASLT